MVAPQNALVIVVEDDVLERMGATAMFLDAGYRVLEAEDADEATRLFEANADVSLLFTDISLPGTISGFDLACTVSERWPEVRIILTSGRPRPGKMPFHMNFHAKPYEPTAVLRHAREMTA